MFIQSIKVCSVVECDCGKSSQREGKQWNQIEFGEESWMKGKRQRLSQIKRKMWNFCHIDVITFYKDALIIHITLLNIVCSDQI